MASVWLCFPEESVRKLLGSVVLAMFSLLGANDFTTVLLFCKHEYKNRETCLYLCTLYQLHLDKTYILNQFFVSILYCYPSSSWSWKNKNQNCPMQI